MLSDVVVNRLALVVQKSRVHVPALPSFYWVVTLGKLFTHIASPVFSAPRRNWRRTKWSIRTGPL